MIRYRKILELHDEGISLRGIAASTGNSRQKVTEVIRIAEKKGLVCPLEEEMTDQWIEEFLFPEKTLEASGRQPLNFDYIHEELAKPNVTLSLLHHEYEAECRANNKIPYSYRSFLRHYGRYADKYKATLRIRRKPGEIMEVDWAGSTSFIIDRDTGEKIKAYVFVATLPCSQLSYAEATLSMDLHSWITAHNHAYKYFGGTTQILVPDNLKASVTKHTARELILNPTYREMADYYNTVVMPARVRTPKDKASVEGSVNAISTWIIAALRNTHCFSIDELNEEVWRKLDEFNHRPFTRKKGCRWSAFEEEEKFALSPLPSVPYKMSEWKTAKVRPDYHISVESMFYSVPYEYINRQVEVKLSDNLVEIFFNHMRIASHKRLYGKFGQLSTIRDHMPDNHKLFVDQTPEAAFEWAESIGESALNVVQYILGTSQTEKQALQSIFTLKKSERRYTKYEIERACKMIISMTKRPTVKSIQTILKNNKKNDAEQELKRKTEISENNYGFTRGASYYGGNGSMMNEQTLTKLHELKLSGMAEAYKEQALNKEFQKMSFEDRFSLLVDLEHSRRKSNKLQRLIKTATFINPNACIEDIEYHEDRRLDKDLILKLAGGAYIHDHHNIILKGPTGSGKSYLASAFGVSACRQFYKVKYIRLPELLDELSLAKLAADGSYRKCIKKYTKVDLLILDEWLLTDLSTNEAGILLEIAEARHKVASTIFCSQIDPGGWHLKLGNETIAEAILDRIIHDSYQIMIDGEVSNVRAPWIGRSQMIPIEVENRIAKYFFHTYLPDDVMSKIEDKLLSTCIWVKEEDLDYDELVRMAIEIMDRQLENKRLR